MPAKNKRNLSLCAEKIFQLFRQEVIKKRIIQLNDHILLAYSGGADSTCLLSLLERLRQEIPFALSLAHLNHGLRASALEDEAFVRQVAQEFSLPLVIKRVKVRSYARRHRLNLEEAGRQLRYAFLEETRKRLKATKIATAHTRDDQAETFLLRLFRGSGPRGLAGISPEIEGKIIRPLLLFRRPQIEAYLQQVNLPFCFDESNLDRRYLRNRIRFELIPFLEKKYDPEIIVHLARAAEILGEEEDFFSRIEAEASWRIIQRQGASFQLEAEALAKIHPALARRLVRRFLVHLRGDLRETNFKEIEAVRQLQPGEELHLRRKIKLVRLGPYIMEKKTLAELRSYKLFWDGKSKVEIPGIGLEFSGRIANSCQLPPYDDAQRACLRLERLRFPLLLRARQPGDRYQPIGAPKPRKLKDIMSRHQIPAYLKPFLPVFLSGEEIVWVPGCPVNEAYKVQGKDERLFIIEKL